MKRILLSSLFLIWASSVAHAQGFQQPQGLACPNVTAINQTGSTDLHTFTNKARICSVVLISATAQSLSLVEGTGSTCGSNTAALIGGTSASMAVAANGGFSGVAAGPWLNMITAGDHLCLLQSGAGNVSGIITWADQ